MTFHTIFKRITSIAFSGILLLSAQTALALPNAYQADYSVAKGSMTLGNLHTSLKYSGNRYAYHKYTKATGIAALLTGIKITERTDGQFSGQNIIPQSYFYNMSRHGKSRIDKVNFNQRKAAGSYDGTPYQLNTPPNTQDRASLEISLARDLSFNKKRLSYSVITHGEKTQYNFQRIGNEKIKTPAGTFNTVKVKVIRSGSKRDTTFWMAKELGFIPVKINHREKDTVIISVLKNYKKL